MSKLNPLYERWDVMYFRNLHKERQAQMWNQPVNYNAFYERLKKWESLKEAIYTPRLRAKKHKPNIESEQNMKPKKPSLRIRFISLFR